ncbi:cytochrome c oxidase, subunit III [Mucilaginibacter paludis DSM 18603]|uniref:Cytochrome c oxidase, subunit III n=2 Tax=Mucilaginibacter TaxID=423349 RepID=H1Y2J2_9SPHI|nr:cytochrome c oxidase, subunit III [Mucilaginibacter paludis DSM 18603]
MAQLQQDKDKLDLAPRKFNMWLFVFTSFMFFAALTSGFIVYSGGSTAHGIKIILPQAFKYSTLVIIISSVTLYLAARAAKRLEFAQQRLFLWLTALLGIAFFVIQIYAWGVLVNMGVHFVNPNASQSFIYVFTGMHLLHIVAGLGLLFYAIAGSYKNIGQVKNLFRMEFASIFWHFIDIIWIYLYVFLLLNQY